MNERVNIIESHILSKTKSFYAVLFSLSPTVEQNQSDQDVLGCPSEGMSNSPVEWS